MQRLKVGFVMFTEVGLKTQYLNWKHALTPEVGIDPVWIAISWWEEGGSIERLPLVPSGVKARLRGQTQLREGLAQAPFDALFIGSNMVYVGQRQLKEQPYFITTDVTPKQLHDFGSLYNKLPSKFEFVEAKKEKERRAYYQNARLLFPWSHWAKQSMVEDYGVDPGKAVVMPPGVDIARWAVPTRTHDGTTHILFVGGDFYRKGGDLLLEWAKQTPKREWQLHLVTRDTVQTDDPRIHVYNGLSPNDPELQRLYAQAHIFALPTRGDCYSLAGIEAMATGLPVILSKTGGTGDIIRDGETGYLIGAGAGDALAERLDYLLENPTAQIEMGQAARQDAELRYDACKNIVQTVQKIRDALGAAA
jgi:glycosyltransferase involved in cell wall biosynthesis